MCVSDVYSTVIIEAELRKSCAPGTPKCVEQSGTYTWAGLSLKEGAVELSFDDFPSRATKLSPSILRLHARDAAIRRAGGTARRFAHDVAIRRGASSILLYCSCRARIAAVVERPRAASPRMMRSCSRWS